MSAKGCFDDCDGCRDCECMDFGRHRNSMASIASGMLFALGWWLMIDAAVVDEVVPAHHTVGVFSTIGLIMINAVSSESIDNDAYTEGACGPNGAKFLLISGLCISFSGLIAGIWLMVQEYIEKGNDTEYAGTCLMLQNLFIFMSSMLFKFGRVDEDSLY